MLVRQWYLKITALYATSGLYEGLIGFYDDADSITVHLDDLHPLLSPRDKEQLSRILSDIELESPNQEDNWLSQYAVACSFIHSVL